MNIEQRRDPLLRAGHITCGICDVRAYPSDATWVGLDGILVTYPTACPHRGTETWLIDVSHTATPECVRCVGQTKAGTRCRRRATHGRDRCHQHSTSEAAR